MIGSKLLRQFLSFASVGVFAVATHYLTLIALVELGKVPPLTASIVGFFAGGVISYVFNQRLTFSERPSLVRGVTTFFAMIGIGAILNAAIVAGLLALHVWYLAAQAAATGIVLFWNFFSCRTFVFKEPTR